MSDTVIPTVNDPSVRHEFVLLFDVKEGNPNGDPDAGNAPRSDAQTGHGIVTDVALKRKIRDFLGTTQGTDIFIQSQEALNKRKSDSAAKLPALTKEEREGKRVIPALQAQMATDYYDIRMFGAVLATGDKADRLNAGQVRGPVQITFARSIDPIRVQSATITRQARTTEERMLTGTTEIGRKAYIHYGLYRAHGFFNPYLAVNDRINVTSDDLGLLWLALQNMFTFDRSASRGEMAVRGLYVFSHSSKLGNAPAHKLFKLIDLPAIDGAPRSFDEYTVTAPPDGPLEAFSGVTLTRLEG